MGDTAFDVLFVVAMLALFVVIGLIAFSPEEYRGD